MRDEIEKLHEIKAIYNLKILALFALWLGPGALAVYVDSLFVRIPCWIVMGFSLHGLGVVMHDGAHNALFGTKVFDRVIGFIAGIPVLFSCSNYRATHLLHHRFENTPQDPDNLEANMPNKVMRWFVYYGWFVVGMPMYVSLLVLVGPFRAESWKERFICLLETSILVSIYYGV
ncbi:MAG: fatty acid desaturase, partial [Myxococcales bacterium]|nr:fatty acid desaturase [Myxococcales bacterium]